MFEALMIIGACELALILIRMMMIDGIIREIAIIMRVGEFKTPSKYIEVHYVNSLYMYASLIRLKVSLSTFWDPILPSLLKSTTIKNYRAEVVREVSKNIRRLAWKIEANGGELPTFEEKLNDCNTNTTRDYKGRL